MFKLQLSASFKAQILATIAVNIISFGYGLTTGWLSPVLPLLQSKDSPFVTGSLTVEQTSWIGSLISAGSIIGNYLYSFVSDRYGRKCALNFLAFPQIGFWLIVLFGDSYYHLYVARILAGITGGGVLSSIPLFIADIAEPPYRGRLGFILLIVLNVGVFVSYTIGAFVPYYTFPVVTVIVPVSFAIIVIFFPETPQSLIKRNDLDGAKSAFKFYRGIKKTANLQKDYFDEFDAMIMKNSYPTDTEKHELHLKDFGSRAAIRGLTIGITLMILNQFTGGFVIMNYAAPLLRDTGSILSPNLASMIIAALQIAGTIAAASIIDKVGRKVLLLISSTCMAIGMAVLGTYTYLHHHKYDVSNFAVIPVLCLSFIVFVWVFGIATVPFVLLAEVLPPKIRSIGSLISMTVLTGCTFIVLKFFPILALQIELHGCMWCFAGVAAFGTIFISLVVTETKGTVLNNVGKH